VEEEQEEIARLGNAGEPADLTYAWIKPVVFNTKTDWKLLCMLAEARGKGCDTLDDV